MVHKAGTVLGELMLAYVNKYAEKTTNKQKIYSVAQIWLLNKIISFPFFLPLIDQHTLQYANVIYVHIIMNFLKKELEVSISEDNWPPALSLY